MDRDEETDPELAGSEPVFVLDPEGRILRMNEAAVEKLARQDALFVRDGRLRASGAKGVDPISERLETLNQARQLIISDTAPLKVGADQPYFLRIQRRGTRTKRRYVLTGQDAFANVQQVCSAYALSHGLGPDEESLLLALLKDQSIDEYCARTSRPVTSERSRMKAIFRATGHHKRSSVIIAALLGVRGGATENRSPSRARLSSLAPARGADEPPVQSERIDRRIYADGRAAIPSSAALVAFEAFVRLGSMQRAAQELQTATGNVSRHINRLAEATSLTLVQGRRPRVSASPRGREIASITREAIAVLMGAVTALADDANVEDLNAGRPPLPSFARLLALEAFVKCGSLKAAALELHTSPSNVGHAIRQLEATVGAKLTTGARTRARATPGGLRLAEAATAAFDLIQKTVRVVEANTELTGTKRVRK